jgi:predicted permease
VRGRVYAGDPREFQNSINRLVISPNFFDVMEIPILTGRGFTPRDDENAPKVAVINEAAMKKYFPNENPIGQRFGSSIENSGQIEIVGVLRDAKYNSLRDPAPPTMYVPYLQGRGGGSVIAVRTATAPATVTSAVREAVRQVDPNLPMMDISTQLEQVERRFAQEKIFAQAYTLFSSLALLLAAIGLFGLMSYSVSRRTNEIGIRMALGAQRHDVLRLVLQESLILVVVGVGIGVAVALGTGRFVSTLLYGLAPTDVSTLAGATILMLVVATFAGVVPARRASHVDPMVALRYD